MYSACYKCLSLLLLPFIFFQHLACAGAPNLQSVVVLSAPECQNRQNIIKMDPDQQYMVQINLASSVMNCSTEQERKGFFCGCTLHQTDDFTFVGSKLCVDLQGIPITMTNTQLLITVQDSVHSLKYVYATTILRPEGEPFYVCATETYSSISVSLSVRDSVKMCPTILNSMLDQNISFGTFMLRPLVPIYTLNMDRCNYDIHPQEDIYILKVISESSISKCMIKIPAHQFESTTNACIELLYVSPAYKCNVTLELSSSSQSVISFAIPDSPLIIQQQGPVCNTYSSNPNDDENVVLSIVKKAEKKCYGKFAIKVSYTWSNDQEDSSDNSDDSAERLKHLYMAVFVSLICFCVLILGLICVCCIRMRSKRRRAIERIRAEAASTPITIFDVAPVEASCPPLSWRSSNSGQIVGLPSYNEIFGPNSAESENEARQDFKEKKPPAYDDLF